MKFKTFFKTKLTGLQSYKDKFLSLENPTNITCREQQFFLKYLHHFGQDIFSNNIFDKYKLEWFVQGRQMILKNKICVLT